MKIYTVITSLTSFSKFHNNFWQDLYANLSFYFVALQNITGLIVSLVIIEGKQSQKYYIK